MTRSTASRLLAHRAPRGDAAFLAAFETAAVPRSEWDHLSHLRVARLLVERHPLPAAIDRVRRGIQRLNAANGIPVRGYHETVTVAFMLLVGDAYLRDPGVSSLDFIIRHGDLADPKVLESYYSPERIESAEARQRFVTPDRRPLPELLRAAS